MKRCAAGAAAPRRAVTSCWRKRTRGVSGGIGGAKARCNARRVAPRGVRCAGSWHGNETREALGVGPPTAGTCRDMVPRREAWWTCVQIDGVEPTPHPAERSSRPGVLGRKGSCGTQREEGSRCVESMMTVVSTLQQQQHNALEYLTEACDAAPSLLPANAQKSHTAA